jgi:hypothetical protein
MADVWKRDKMEIWDAKEKGVKGKRADGRCMENDKKGQVGLWRLLWMDWRELWRIY